MSAPSDVWWANLDDAAMTWNPTPEQRKHASDTLIDLWELAEEWNDVRLERIVKQTLDSLGLPWVRLPTEDAEPFLAGDPVLDPGAYDGQQPEEMTA